MKLAIPSSGLNVGTCDAEPSDVSKGLGGCVAKSSLLLFSSEPSGIESITTFLETIPPTRLQCLCSGAWIDQVYTAGEGVLFPGPYIEVGWGHSRECPPFSSARSQAFVPFYFFCCINLRLDVVS